MSQIDQSAIDRAAQLLCAGGLVAFPTETVYGLGANALDALAVAKIFEAKQRPQFNPLIVHLCSIEAVEAVCEFPNPARALAKAFWPGPLTLVLQRKANCAIADLVSAGLPTLAVRIPAHPVARALLKAANVPVAAPSANRSGHVSATKAAHVSADLEGRVGTILDAGATPLGLESTIIAVQGTASSNNANTVALLRTGAIETAAIENLLGFELKRSGNPRNAAPLAPGQLTSHYAPNTPMRLNAKTAQDGEALLAFGPEVPSHSGPCLNLSPRANLLEAAANLFSHLRELDARGVKGIAVMPVPSEGLGEAINDRLTRASAPRIDPKIP